MIRHLIAARLRRTMGYTDAPAVPVEINTLNVGEKFVNQKGEPVSMIPERPIVVNGANVSIYRDVPRKKITAANIGICLAVVFLVIPSTILCLYGPSDQNMYFDLVLKTFCYDLALSCRNGSGTLVVGKDEMWECIEISHRLRASIYDAGTVRVTWLGRYFGLKDKYYDGTYALLIDNAVNFMRNTTYRYGCEDLLKCYSSSMGNSM